jgi:integrase
MACVKAPFNWAFKVRIFKEPFPLEVIEKVPTTEVDRQVFTPDDIRRLLDHATVQMRAMILLGINCAFGCTDCALLQWSSLDLNTRRVDFPRPKTKVPRRFRLWPHTVEALQAIPQQGDNVFYTKDGNTWAWRLYRDADGKIVCDDKPLTKAFKRLMKQAGVVGENGTGFYTLRRTGATIVAQSGNVFAVQAYLGHRDIKMASTYVQRGKLTAQSDQAIWRAWQWLNPVLDPISAEFPADGEHETDVAVPEWPPVAGRAESPEAAPRTHQPTPTGCATEPCPQPFDRPA